MTINGDLTLEGVAADCPLTTSKLEAVKESVKKSVESLVCNQQNTKNGTSCKANVTSVSCTEGKRLLSLRRLNTASLVVKYEIIFKAVCETFDCTTAEATGNALYKQVSGDITNAINDGTLVKKLKASDPVAASVFQSVTRIQNQLEPVIIPILASFIWYPDWIGRSGKCLNDGNAPSYMMTTGHFLETNQKDCCDKHYNYDLAACMGKSSTVALGYYPDWSQTESKCVKDANVPDYMRQKAATYIFDDIESCCKRFYNWEANKCIANSGGANAAGKVGTKKWYVDHSKGSCKQDNDGGAESWNHLYISLDECCSKTLWWITREDCRKKST